MKLEYTSRINNSGNVRKTVNMKYGVSPVILEVECLPSWLQNLKFIEGKYRKRCRGLSFSRTTFVGEKGK